MNIHFEVRIRVGVSVVGGDYSTMLCTKKFDNEDQAKKLLEDLRAKADNSDDSLADFLWDNFGHEEFDVCNFRTLGLFKITEEKLQ